MCTALADASPPCGRGKACQQADELNLHDSAVAAKTADQRNVTLCADGPHARLVSGPVQYVRQDDIAGDLTGNGGAAVDTCQVG